MIRHLGLALIFATISSPAFAQWAARTTTDEMTNERTVSASRLASVQVTNSIGERETPRLIVRCRAHDIQVIVTFATQLFTTFDDDYGSTVDLRVDDEPVVETRWDGSDSGRGLFYGGARPYQTPEPEGDQSTIGLVRRLLTGNALHLRFHPPLNSAQYTRFSLAGSGAALTPVLAACGVSAEPVSPVAPPSSPDTKALDPPAAP